MAAHSLFSSCYHHAWKLSSTISNLYDPNANVSLIQYRLSKIPKLITSRTSGAPKRGSSKIHNSRVCGAKLSSSAPKKARWLGVPNISRTTGPKSLGSGSLAGRIISFNAIPGERAKYREQQQEFSKLASSPQGRFVYYPRDRSSLRQSWIKLGGGGGSSDPLGLAGSG